MGFRDNRRIRAWIYDLNAWATQECDRCDGVDSEQYNYCHGVLRAISDTTRKTPPVVQVPSSPWGRGYIDVSYLIPMILANEVPPGGSFRSLLEAAHGKVEADRARRLAELEP
jgi:hypothetical protein